jgi:hypothetical protein
MPILDFRLVDANPTDTQSRSRKMRTVLGATICSAMIALAALSSPSFAQQKTVKACEDEWRANRAANQAAGVTQKAYVEKCRAGTAPTQAAPAALAQPAPARPAATTTTPPPAPAARQPTTARPAAPPPPTTAVAPSGGNQFSAEAQAKARCPSDTVVWVNTDSKIYHFTGYSDYGKTKKGTYMCEGDATAGGFRAAKNEKHP